MCHRAAGQKWEHSIHFFRARNIQINTSSTRRKFFICSLDMFLLGNEENCNKILIEHFFFNFLIENKGTV